MNKILTAILTIVCTNLYAQHPEKYFRFVEADRDVISTKITHIVSIDKKSQDTLWAYANANEFEQFTKLGYKIEILTPPSLSTAKALNMATTAEQMVNWDKYPTYEVYRTMLQQFEDDYPALCKLDSIGTTANGRKLYVLKISDNVLNNEAEPELFYTSTMHGDETTGYILMLRLADSLLQGYSTSSRIKEMVDNMAIYINPNANPDGTYYYGNNTVSGATRYNGNSIDLNRNFPDPRTGDHPDGNSWQPETQAMMDFAEGRNFVLSANFHGGVELANYPWDTWESADNPHPDHNWYYTISRAYADTVHLYCPSDYFTGESNGVTHGGDWYVVTGGRQDYMNYWQHCREFTLEISDTKLLGTELLPAHWTYNKASILNHMELAYTGFYGTVTNAAGDALPAKITILNHDKDSSEVFTNPSHGNYYRMISPGIYTIKFTSAGYDDVTITDTEIGNNENRIINIVMDGTITPQNISGTVLNNINNAPIANASVVVTSGSTTYQTITNADGQFTINSVLKGLIRIDVTAAKFYATTYHQNLTATQTAFTIKLMGLPLANVSFAIKSKNEPLIGAKVQFDQSQAITNSEGLTHFADIPLGKNYNYAVSLNGYNNVQGHIDVSKDSTYTITLYPTAIDNTENTKESLDVSPNPFSEFTTISCKIDKPSNIDIRIFDIMGREIIKIYNGHLPEGTHRWEWSYNKDKQSEAASNIYIVKFNCNGKTISKKIIHIN